MFNVLKNHNSMVLFSNINGVTEKDYTIYHSFFLKKTYNWRPPKKSGLTDKTTDVRTVLYAGIQVPQ